MNYVANGYVRSGYIRQDNDTLSNISFDRYGKQIFLSESIAKIDLADVYSRSVDWLAQDENLKVELPMRYSGYDPIPGGFTGATFFMTNGWKLVYNPNTTAITGVLFSEDYDTGYWTYNGLPIYPIMVAATVNTVYKEMGVSGLTSEESAKLTSLDTSNLDNSISSVVTLIEALKTLEVDERAKLLSLTNDGTSPQEIWEYSTRELTSAPTGGLNESELHTALNNYTGKDGYKADVSTLTTMTTDMYNNGTLTQEQHDALMASATTSDTIVASQL